MSAPSQRDWRPPSATTPARSPLHDLYCAARDAVGCFGRRTGRLRIPVDQHHDVGGAVGQPLRDMQAAAPRADRPVDRAQLVAGHVSADIGVLDTRPDVSRQVGAEPVEQFGAWDRGGLWRRQREHEDVGSVDHTRAHDKPAAPKDSHAGHDRIPAPLVRGDGDRLPLAGSRLDRFEPHAVNGLEREIRRHVAGVGVFPDGPHVQPGFLGLEAPRRAGLCVHVNPRHRALPPD
jgi:hypothetical protein